MTIERNPLQESHRPACHALRRGPDGDDDDPGAAALALVTARLLALWPQLLFMVIGLNECAVRLDVLPDGRIAYRMVTPDVLRDVTPDDHEPDRPRRPARASLASPPWPRRWAYEVFDVRDPDVRSSR